MIFWLTTAPHPDAPATGYDAGQRGWRTHAVEAEADSTFDNISQADVRAACGLRAAHGWGMDLFIDRRCERCVKALGLEFTPTEAYVIKQREEWRQRGRRRVLPAPSDQEAVE